LIDALCSRQLDRKSQKRLRKVLEIMLIGELFGLHTLKKILDSFDIKSTNLYKIWGQSTYLQIKNMVSRLGVAYFKEALGILMSKSDSSWSRSSVTIVADDSIFRQWLKNADRGKFYDKFYSGQYSCSVYGFRVQLIGVALGDDFHPLFFHLVAKNQKSKDVVVKLVKKVHAIFTQISEKQGVDFPNLYLSVDSGFTGKKLTGYCGSANIGLIGVPKKNNVFTIDGQKMNPKTFIEKVYIGEEEKFKKENPGKTFLMRRRAYFHAQDREVILLFFRLNGSKNVSVVFCTDLSIKAKTLRRRFFQRTKIELFFRFLKDTLKIQKSKSTDYKSFIKKLSLFIFKAIICLQFEKYCRKKFRCFKGWAFTKLRHHLVYQDIDKTLLENIIITKPFAT